MTFHLNCSYPGRQNTHSNYRWGEVASSWHCWHSVIAAVWYFKYKSCVFDGTIDIHVQRTEAGLDFFINIIRW